MQTKIRSIGSSRGVIIPIDILTEFEQQKDQYHSELDIHLHDDKIIISKQKNTLRAGWFDQYQAQNDIDVLGTMTTLASEENDWQW